ncbi:MAG: hypothetical protein Q8K37_00060, partial [Alphaproteobacteria bacterium]|nr:hypothetical protein [Alphaproteobacteria bacterium]
MEDFYFNEEEKVSVILAVNTIALDYFKAINVFETMQIYTEKKDIDGRLAILESSLKKLFFSSDSKKPIATYFLLEAEDEAGLILKVIQENLHYVKILHAPEGLKMELKERINVF